MIVTVRRANLSKKWQFEDAGEIGKWRVNAWVISWVKYRKKSAF